MRPKSGRTSALPASVAAAHVIRTWLRVKSAAVHCCPRAMTNRSRTGTETPSSRMVDTDRYSSMFSKVVAEEKSMVGCRSWFRGRERNEACNELRPCTTRWCGDEACCWRSQISSRFSLLYLEKNSLLESEPGGLSCPRMRPIISWGIGDRSRTFPIPVLDNTHVFSDQFFFSYSVG